MRWTMVLLMGVCLVNPVLAGDASKGSQKAGLCVGCHGPKGISSVPMYPNLAGQKAAYMEAQLKAYRSGSRVNPMMNSIAKSLSDEDIANLSAFFSQMGSP